MSVGCRLPSPGGLALTERAVFLCSFKKGARIADIGCGDGVYLRFMAGKGWKVEGLDFDEQARAQIEGGGVIALSLSEMLKIVKMWDIAKQKIAVAAFSYFLDAVENSAPLYGRYQAFLTAVEARFQAELKGESPADDGKE